MMFFCFPGNVVVIKLLSQFLAKINPYNSPTWKVVQMSRKLLLFPCVSLLGVMSCDTAKKKLTGSLKSAMDVQNHGYLLKF